VFLTGTVECYQRQRDGARLTGRAYPRLIIGPWTHSIYSGMFVDRRFGMRSAIGELDLAGEQLRWFNRWLKGDQNGVEGEPPVRLFVMGTDRWRDFADFPPPESVVTDFFLHTSADVRRGSLGPTRPNAEAPDALLPFDPDNPVPTLGGASLLEGTWVADRAGPVDIAQLVDRADVLAFSSKPLQRELTIVGPVEARINAGLDGSDSGVGFDLVAHLVDFHPSGRMEVLTSGIRRVSIGRGVNEVHVKVGATAATFMSGHRVGLILAASDFPRFEPNPELTAAGGGSIRITSSLSRPSWLVLHVIDS
jgi:hypothetical protein